MLRIKQVLQEWTVLMGAMMTALFGVNDALDLLAASKLDRWLFVASFIVFFVIVMWRLMSLHSRINEKDRPHIRIQHIARTSPYWMPGAYLHRVGVKNMAGRDAEDVQVWLRKVRPDPLLRIDVIPSKFGHKGGQCSQGNRVCNISVEDEHHFDVIQFLDDVHQDGTRTGENWCWRLVTAEFMHQPINLAIGVNYAFHIRARADGAISDDRVLVVRRNPDDTLDLSLQD